MQAFRSGLAVFPGCLSGGHWMMASILEPVFLFPAASHVRQFGAPDTVLKSKVPHSWNSPTLWIHRTDSNRHTRVTTPVLCPLSYKGIFQSGRGFTPRIELFPASPKLKIQAHVSSLPHRLAPTYSATAHCATIWIRTKEPQSATERELLPPSFSLHIAQPELHWSPWGRGRAFTGRPIYWKGEKGMEVRLCLPCQY